MLQIFQDPYTLSVLVFVAFLAFIVYRDRKKFRRESVVLLRRTQRGKKAIVRLAWSHPRFWKAAGTFGVFSGFLASILIIKFFVELFFRNVYGVATGGQTVASLSFVLPTIGPTASSTPGLFLVPFWYWIISIAVLVVVHEGLHGVMSAVEKVKIKSMGWGVLLIIPLAFVEPDEKRLVKKGFWPQQRVFAAGSFANFITAGVSILLLTGLASAVLQPSGIIFRGVEAGSPAALANLSGIITSIGDFKVITVNDLSASLEKTGPGKQIIVKSKRQLGNGSFSENSFEFVTAENPERPGKGYLGIQGVSEAQEIKEGLKQYAEPLLFIEGLLFFLFMINLGVGMANLLPIKPLDGGRMWEILFHRISKNHGAKITSAVSWLTLFLIIVNFVIPLL